MCDWVAWGRDLCYPFVNRAQALLRLAGSKLSDWVWGASCDGTFGLSLLTTGTVVASSQLSWHEHVSAVGPEVLCAVGDRCYKPGTVPAGFKAPGSLQSWLDCLLGSDRACVRCLAPSAPRRVVDSTLLLGIKFPCTAGSFLRPDLCGLSLEVTVPSSGGGDAVFDLCVVRYYVSTSQLEHFMYDSKRVDMDGMFFWAHGDPYHLQSQAPNVSSGLLCDAYDLHIGDVPACVPLGGRVSSRIDPVTCARSSIQTRVCLGRVTELWYVRRVSGVALSAHGSFEFGPVPPADASSVHVPASAVRAEAAACIPPARLEAARAAAALLTLGLDPVSPAEAARADAHAGAVRADAARAYRVRAAAVAQSVTLRGGLVNKGVTCWLNVVLQCLLRVPGLLSGLIAWGYFAPDSFAVWLGVQNEDYTPANADFLGLPAERRSLLFSHVLALRLMLTDLATAVVGSAVQTDPYLRALRSLAPLLGGGGTQDAEEALTSVVVALGETDPFLRALVQGGVIGVLVRDRLMCAQCEFARVTSVVHPVILLPAVGYQGTPRRSLVQACSAFLASETVGGVNCPECGHAGDHVKQYEFVSAPSCLIIEFGRYAYALGAAVPDHAIDFPVDYTHSWRDPDSALLMHASYTLFAVARHWSTPSHYVCLARAFNSVGAPVWLEMDDSVVGEHFAVCDYDVPSASGVSSRRRASLLFYRRTDVPAFVLSDVVPGVRIERDLVGLERGLSGRSGVSRGGDPSRSRVICDLTPGTSSRNCVGGIRSRSSSSSSGSSSSRSGRSGIASTHPDCDVSGSGTCHSGGSISHGHGCISRSGSSSCSGSCRGVGSSCGIVSSGCPVKRPQLAPDALCRVSKHARLTALSFGREPLVPGVAAAASTRLSDRPVSCNFAAPLAADRPDDAVGLVLSLSVGGASSQVCGCAALREFERCVCFVFFIFCACSVRYRRLARPLPRRICLWLSALKTALIWRSGTRGGDLGGCLVTPSLSSWWHRCRLMPAKWSLMPAKPRSARLPYDSGRLTCLLCATRSSPTDWLHSKRVRSAFVCTLCVHFDTSGVVWQRKQLELERASGKTGLVRTLSVGCCTSGIVWQDATGWADLSSQVGVCLIAVFDIECGVRPVVRYR